MTTPSPTSESPDAQDSTPGNGVLLPKGSLILVFAGLMVSMLMFSLNQTILATALPTIVGELNGVDQMLWVSTAFMLASTIMMPLYGKLGDLFGRKALFIFAISAFIVGSVFGIVADSMNVLIAGRVVQGIGGGGMMILAQAIIADIVPARERGKYMGIMGAVFAVSSVAGPLLGGWFTEGPGWRWTFWMNIPLGALALLAAIFFLKLPKRPADAHRPKLDIGGAALIAIFTSSLILVTVWGESEYEWTDPVILGLGAAAVVAGVLLVIVERKVSEPIIPPALFKERNFVLSTIAGLAIGVAMFGVLGYMPTYLQMALAINATAAGLLMIPMMGTMLISSTLIGFVVARTGRYKVYPILGVLVITLALYLLSTLSADAQAWMISLYLGVMGLGLGLSMQLLVLIVQNSFPGSMVGTATAANNFFRQIGATMGMAVVGALFTNRLMDNLAARLPQGADAGATSSTSLTPDAVAGLPPQIQEAIVTSYNDALVPLFLLLVPLTVVATIVLLFLKERPLATKVDRNVDTLAESRAEQDDQARPIPAPVEALHTDENPIVTKEAGATSR